MFRAVAARYNGGAVVYQDPSPGYHRLPGPVPRRGDSGADHAQRSADFCLPFTFRRAVTVQSFVLRGFTAAEEKILLTLEEAQALIPENNLSLGGPCRPMQEVPP